MTFPNVLRVTIPGSEKTLYQADCPHIHPETAYEKIQRIAYNIISVIFLPLGIIRLINQRIHVRIGEMLLMQGKYFNEQDLVKMHADLKELIGGEKINIYSATGEKINGWYIDNPSARRVFVYCGGSGYNYEEILENPHLINRIKKAGFSLILFNYPGVNESEGVAAHEAMVNATDGIFHYLKDVKKFAPENMIFYGHSLGGMVVARVAKKHPNIKLFFDRTFSSAEKWTIEFLTKAFRLPKCLAYLFAKYLKLIGWDYDLAKAFKDLKGKKIVVYHPKDKVILTKASLATAVNGWSDAKVIEMKDDYIQMPLGKPLSHTRNFTDKEWDQMLDALEHPHSR